MWSLNTSYTCCGLWFFLPRGQDWFEGSGEPPLNILGHSFPFGSGMIGNGCFLGSYSSLYPQGNGHFSPVKRRKKRGSEINFFFSKECSYRAMTQPIQTIKHPLPTVGENTTAKSFHAQCPWSPRWQGKGRHWSWVLFALNSFQCWWCYALWELYPWEAVFEGPVIALLSM